MIGLIEYSYTQLLLKHIHELNQPLTVIKAYLGGCELRLQKNELTSEQMINVLRKISEHTKLFENTIFLMQKIITQENSIKVSNLITEVTSLFSFEIKYFAIDLVLDFHDELSHFNMNSSQFKQALFSLLKQCIDAVEKNRVQTPKIVIQTRCKKNILTITIKSNFTIEDDDLEKKLTYCRFLLSEDCATISTELLANGIGILLTMFQRDSQYDF